MKIVKRVLFLLLLGLLVIQFIRPQKNVSTQVSPNHIAAHYTVPKDVEVILDKACNDCHSNNTRYPWYAEIQPVAWWLADHVEDGKKHLNFDDFATYRLRKQYHKLEETDEMVREKHMPLDSYLWMHKEAELTQEERQRLVEWSLAVRKEMEAKYPMDSLISRK